MLRSTIFYLHPVIFLFPHSISCVRIYRGASEAVSGRNTTYQPGSLIMSMHQEGPGAF
jgi:hypothetical protein